ncbi:MAG: BON domain-containing protein [Ktedonobacterales bacterium]
MNSMTGPVRYLFLRMTRGREEVENWPPTIKPLEGPDNIVCASIRLYGMNTGWQAECGSDEGRVDEQAKLVPPLILTRATVLGLLQGGKRGKAEVELLGVRVVNLNGKGVEYASHFVVAALPGSGLGLRRPVVVPLDGLVLDEYIEHGSQAVASLGLRLAPSDYANMPQYMADNLILRQAKRTLDQSILSPRARHGITLEADAGRISLHGRAELTSFGDQATEALLQSPGVVEVADHLLYDEELTDQVSAALAAKGFTSITVLTEHGLINLRGEATDSASRYQAEDIAKRTPGVRAVVNDITLAGNHATSAPVSNDNGEQTEVPAAPPVVESIESK